jgi:hypothetical protein
MTCAACASGKFTATAGRASCRSWRRCYEGKGLLLEGTSTQDRKCTACEVGVSYSDVKDGAACKAVRAPCAAGTHITALATASSDLVCAACSIGEHQHLEGQANCDKCAAGKFRNTALAGSSEAVACTACAAGQYQGSDAKTTCVDCAAGTFQVASGQPSCDNCAEGTFQPAPKAIGCDGCVAGEFQNEAGQTSCKACDAHHFYQDVVGQAACKHATVCEKIAYQTKATTATSDRECKHHTICKRPEWEIKYEGTHHDRECSMRQVCQHTHCQLHGGKIRVQHHKNDHLAGFTHHHCKFDVLQQKCVCMCHNRKIDNEYAYNPKDRFFWKKKTETQTVHKTVGAGCAGTQYSPDGADAPSTMELCRADSVGHKVVVGTDLPFQPMSDMQVGQAASIVSFDNDRLSFQGQESQCEGVAVQTSTTSEVVTVYECVQEECPHPLCCDCGNEFCSRGHASGACAVVPHWATATQGQSYNTPTAPPVYHPLDQVGVESHIPALEADRTSGAAPGYASTLYPRRAQVVSP